MYPKKDISNINENISPILNSAIGQAIENKVFTCAEVFVALNKNVIFHDAFGTHLPDAKGDILQKNSLFDLASLTKPLATTLAVLKLVERKELDLSQPLEKHIPEFRDGRGRRITISQLLTHTSGLPDWRPLYEPGFDKLEAWKKLVSTKLLREPGEVTVYSCLGFILLGEIIRRITDLSLDQFCQREIFGPMDLKTLMFNPLDKGIDIDVVPMGFCSIRNRKLIGLVHDENAAVFDGEGGNSGLFGTVADIHKLCCMILNQGYCEGRQVISSELVGLLFKNQNPVPMEPRTLGWDIKSGEADYWSCGSLMPEGSIGHLGFTGTSLWMDPKSQLIILILTNRVSISREDNIEMMREFRPRIHTLILKHCQQLLNGV